jgi:hypothetical protein
LMCQQSAVPAARAAMAYSAISSAFTPSPYQITLGDNGASALAMAVMAVTFAPTVFDFATLAAARSRSSERGCRSSAPRLSAPRVLDAVGHDQDAEAMAMEIGGGWHRLDIAKPRHPR